MSFAHRRAAPLWALADPLQPAAHPGAPGEVSRRCTFVILCSFAVRSGRSDGQPDPLGFPPHVLEPPTGRGRLRLGHAAGRAGADRRLLPSRLPRPDPRRRRHGLPWPATSAAPLGAASTQPAARTATRRRLPRRTWRCSARRIVRPRVSCSTRGRVAPADATVDRVALLLLLGVLSGTGLALLAGLMLARRAMAPIARLTAPPARSPNARPEPARPPRPRPTTRSPSSPGPSTRCCARSTPPAARPRPRSPASASSSPTPRTSCAPR